MKSKILLISVILVAIAATFLGYNLGHIHGQRLGLRVGSATGVGVALKNARLIRENKIQEALSSLELYGIVTGEAADFPPAPFYPIAEEYALPPWAMSVTSLNASSSKFVHTYLTDFPDHVDSNKK